MNPALATLLSHPAIWRGDDCAPEPATLPSGFAALDAALPGRGWPQGALTEVLLEREGIGELRLDAARARARAGAGTRRRVDRASLPSLCTGARRGGARSRAPSHRALSRCRRMRCGRTSRRCARPNAARLSRGLPSTTSACCGACRSRRAKAARGACCGGVPGNAAGASAAPLRLGLGAGMQPAGRACAEAPRRRVAAAGHHRSRSGGHRAVARAALIRAAITREISWNIISDV